jgi:hypothetical protein
MKGKPKQPKPKRKSDWLDDIRHPSDSPNLLEKSEIFAGPRQMVRITVTKEKKRMFYWMTCNIIRDADDQPVQNCLSASTMAQAKEESIDMVRILLHHVLCDI